MKRYLVFIGLMFLVSGLIPVSATAAGEGSKNLSFYDPAWFTEATFPNTLTATGDDGVKRSMVISGISTSQDIYTGKYWFDVQGVYKPPGTSQTDRAVLVSLLADYNGVLHVTSEEYTDGDETLWPYFYMDESYFDQEFIYIRFGVMKSSFDTTIEDVVYRKYRNPYYQKKPTEDVTDYAIITHESDVPGISASVGDMVSKKLFEKPVYPALPHETFRMDGVRLFDAKAAGAAIANTSSRQVTGDVKNFWVEEYNYLYVPYEIPARLAYSGTKADVWVHDKEITDQQAKQIADEFDSAIHPLITSKFGVESDVDHNGKIDILIYNIPDDFSRSGSYAGAAFSPQDLYATATSNEGEVLKLDTYPTMGTDPAALDVKLAFPMLAHEFQHLVNYNRNVFVEQGPQMERWLDEALSLAAEQLYLKQPLSGLIQFYGQSEYIAQGAGFKGGTGGPGTYSNAEANAGSYLFGQYLRVQSGRGDSIYRELLEYKGSASAAVANALNAYVAPGKPVGEFMADFHQAFLANEPTGLYGFRGDPLLSGVFTPIYRHGAMAGRELYSSGAIILPLADVERYIEPRNTDPEINIRLVDVNEGVPTPRLAGFDRYHTAAVISRELTRTADTVIIATGANFPDALAGGPLAYKENAPILLTKADVLTADAEWEIDRLGPKKAIILGSKGAVSVAVEDQLRRKGLTVERIGGKTRYETAALIAARLPSAKAVIANGTTFPDVLAVSPYAAKNGIPILLTKKDEVPAETKAALAGKTKTIIVGQTGAVSAAVASQLPAPVRYGGKTRYETAKVINTALPLGTGKAFVATGTNFPDALAGSVLAARQNAPVLLVAGSTIPQPTADLLGKYDSFYVFGSSGAVGADVSRALKQELLTR